MVRVSVLISDDRVSACVLLIFQFAFFQLGVTKSELPPLGRQERLCLGAREQHREK